MAQDNADLSSAAKEVSKAMASPSEADVAISKRVKQKTKNKYIYIYTWVLMVALGGALGFLQKCSVALKFSFAGRNGSARVAGKILIGLDRNANDFHYNRHNARMRLSHRSC